VHSRILLTLIAFTLPPGIAQGQALFPPSTSCAASPSAPASWPSRTSVRSSFVSLALPPDAVADSVPDHFTVPPPDSASSLSVGDVTLHVSPALVDTFWIDSVPISPYARGNDGMIDLVSCTRLVDGLRAFIVTGRGSGWSTAYYAEAIVQRQAREYVHVTVTAVSRTSYQALLPVLSGIHIERPRL
jgi:hypothetical protein